MVRPTSGLKALVFAVWAGSLLMLASTVANAEKRVAFIIGNAEYEHTSKLANTVNDAVAVAEMLNRLGFKFELALNTKLDQFLNHMSRFVEMAKDADVAVLYYAGHAIQIDGENYLIPVDGRVQPGRAGRAVSTNFYPLSAIAAEFQAASKTTLMFLDACRDNPLTDDYVKLVKAEGRNTVATKGLASMQGSSRDSMIFFAAEPGEVASDGTTGNSPFTAAVLKHLAAPGLALDDLLRGVRQDVMALTNNRQRPVWESGLTRSFAFSSGQITGAALTERQLWDSIKASRNAKVLRAYEVIYPDSPFARAARQRRKALEFEAERVWKTVADSQGGQDVRVLRAYKDLFPASSIADKALRLAIAASRVVFEPVRFNPNAKPSFNCRSYRRQPKGSRSRTVASDLLCIDEKLAAVDRKLGEVYRAYRETLDPTERFSLIVAQRRWVKARDHRCDLAGMTWTRLADGRARSSLAACLRHETEQRIGELDRAASNTATRSGRPGFTAQ